MATKILIGHTLAISNTMTVKIEINQEECIQCGKCYNDECPDVFMEGDDGTSMIVEQFRVSGDAGRCPTTSSIAPPRPRRNAR